MQTVRKRKTPNKAPAVKTSRIEEKLDGLYTLLQSSAQSVPPATDNGSATSAPLSVQPSPGSLDSGCLGVRDEERLGNLAVQRVMGHAPMDGLRLHDPVTAPDVPYSVSGTRSVISQSPQRSLAPGMEPSLEEAEVCLDVFRLQMTGCFPFVTVPAATTASVLRVERPFLWLSIMSICSRSSEQQLALGREVRIIMSLELLLEGKNNIDLLLGIMVYLSWYVNSCCMAI